MKKIEEIKNEISRDLGNENFKELFKNAVRNMPIEKAFLKINDIINEASLIYANKCVKDSLKKASEKAEIIILSNGELNYDNNFKKKYMNKLCPEDISFKFIKSLAMQDEHAILMRNEEYGIQCEKYTKKINEFQFGKPKIYFFIDGSEKEYTDIQELCNDWNENITSLIINEEIKLVNSHYGNSVIFLCTKKQPNSWR